MNVPCERCGARTRRSETATHQFCERCASLAATGARKPNELLFSVRPPAIEETLTSAEVEGPLEDAAPFDERITLEIEERISLIPIEDERVSLTPMLVVPIDAPSLAPPPTLPPRRTSARMIGLAVIAIALAVGGSAAAIVGARNAEREPDAPAVANASNVPAPSAEPRRVEVAAAEMEAAEVEATAVEATEVEPVEVDAARAVDVTPLALPAPAHATPVARNPIGAATPPPESTPPTDRRRAVPDRQQVLDSLAAVGSRVQSCGGGGIARTQIVFQGATGRVVHSEVLDANARPEVRSCVARAARDARLAPFGRERFVVVYPFQL